MHTEIKERVTMPHIYHCPTWLKNAVFYEIYPQSFQDSNADGIGDIQGIISRLDYVRSLGTNALWINPIFDSPFKDAGYDVRNYEMVAPRYGTNADLIELFNQAHARGMHVLLDLVPGHTSEEHPWFTASKEADPRARAEFSERYIWTDSWIAGGAGYPFIGGEAERDGTYILNFFKSQPALNYGWAHPQYPWQSEALGKNARATADAMAKVMRFWLSLGADGFRVDMADSLVKSDDEGKPFTIATWRYIFDQVRPDFPEAAFVSEWGIPYQSMQAGFDMDFYLDWHWGGTPNGYAMLLRDAPDSRKRDGDKSYFNADSGTDIENFLAQYEPQLRSAEEAGGYFSLITCNHDTARIAPRLEEREIKLAYATILSLPGVPFIYYGDEIAMNYRNLPTKEGGYVRTGTRTPMQWDQRAKNMGFSDADAQCIYLPIIDEEHTSPLPSDPEDTTISNVSGIRHTPNTLDSSKIPSRSSIPNVRCAIENPHSLWHTMREIIELRHTMPALAADAEFEIIRGQGRCFVFKRHPRNLEDTSSSVIVAVNPSREAASFDINELGISKQYAKADSIIFSIGQATWDSEHLQLSAQSFCIIKEN